MLLDTCVWGGAVPLLQECGHDVTWSGEWDEDPGDEKILEIAHADGRVLITLDRDFGELAVVRNQPHSGIIRLVQISAMQHGPVAANVLERYADELKRGAIVTVGPGRIRIRSVESEE